MVIILGNVPVKGITKPTLKLLEVIKHITLNEEGLKHAYLKTRLT